MERFKSLKDIKSGYVVKLRNGKLAIVMRYCQEHFIKVLCFSDAICYECFYKGLKCINGRDKDIVEVYGLCSFASSILYISTENRPLLWKEEIRPKEMTMEQIENEVIISKVNKIGN